MAANLIAVSKSARRKTMTQRYRKLVASVGLAGVLAASAVPAALAKNGADDPPNHNAGDDNGGLVVKHKRDHKAELRHHHRHHGRKHAEDSRHGKDDPAGHDRNDDRGGDR
jgi:hypothetical protein